MGNGPSLNKINLEELKKIDTFSVNSAFTDYEAWGFYPTYYSVIDHWTIRGIKDDLISFIKKDDKIKRFFISEAIHTSDGFLYDNECFNFSDKVTYILTKWNNNTYGFPKDTKIHPHQKALELIKRVGISTKIDTPKGQWINEIPKYATKITLLPSVVPVTIQIAISLGYTEIGLVGVDARYSDKNNSHYKEDYLITPSFNASAGNDLSPYKSINNYAKSIGVNIYSCTEGSNVNSIYGYKDYLKFINE
jgi:hypothetical protein